MRKDTAFQQILKPLTKKLMMECVQRFRSDYDCEHFDTFSHLKTLIYAHLQNLNSLRTLEAAINSQQIDLSFKVSRSTLSDANNRRSSSCLFWVLEQLMFLLPRQLRKEMNKVVKVLDSTPIKLKGKGYDEWAKNHSTVHWQGLKLHVEYDLELKSHTKIAMSYANYNDSSMGRSWPILTDTIYVFDKGYYDFNWWWSIHEKKSFFVTRLKHNAAIVMKEKQENISDTILEDNSFIFKNKTPRGRKKNLYTDKLRQVIVKREGKNPLVLVTNLFDAPAEMIAELYKKRWEIELFFKWIKQNLKIKKFLGKSENAVKIQIAAALITFLLVKLLKDAMKESQTMQLFFIRMRCSIEKEMRVENYKPPNYHFLVKRGLYDN